MTKAKAPIADLDKFRAVRFSSDDWNGQTILRVRGKALKELEPLLDGGWKHQRVVWCGERWKTRHYFLSFTPGEGVLYLSPA